MVQEMRVDTSALGADIVDMQRLLGEARNQFRITCDEIEELQRMWKGAAAVVFMQQFAEDYSGTRQLFDTIEFTIKHMEYAKKQYDACECEVYGKVQAIRIG